VIAVKASDVLVTCT